jgi:hypothetical protein
MAATVSLEEQSVVVMSTQESGAEFGWMIRLAVFNAMAEDIFHPKSNTYVYTSSGIAVPLIPEVIGGQK